MRKFKGRYLDPNLVFGLVFALSSSIQSAWAFQVDVANAPTNDLALTVGAIQSAQQSLLLNIYELTSAQIANAILSRIQAGVHVEIIEEGQPVGGLSAASQGVQGQIAQAMQAARNGDHLFEMTSKAGGKRRYRFDHAKYAVIDGNSLLIGSENYSPTGNPQPGGLGNRGWEVLIHDPAIAQEYGNIFAQDRNSSDGDILDLASTGSSLLFMQPSQPLSEGMMTAGPVPTHFSASGTLPSLNASAVSRISSPDTSLSGLTELLAGARSSIDLEQMTLDSSWGRSGTSPLVDAIIAAARRGVRVRVLVNDESVFNHPSHPSKPKNGPTVDLLNQTAQSERIDLTAKVANLKAMGVDYIHNKGVLVDGNLTLISSINWDENSVEKNREAAVLITSTEVFGYYESLFNSDWSASADLGMQRQAQAPLSLMELESQGQGLTEAFNCPERLHVTVQMGKLNLKDGEDRDFSSLSDLTVEDDFYRVKQSKKCVLSSREEPGTTEKSQFIQIRERKDGALTLELEGYTVKENKIYSIRAQLLQGKLTGRFASEVYDGSGPSREHLGRATVTLSDQ